jgi:hypothetical protein
MNFLRKNKALIAVILTVLILILIRSLSSNHFKNNAKRWAEPSVKRSNIVNPDQADKLPGDKLIVNLTAKKPDNNPGIKQLNVPADSILSKKYFGSIKDNQGPVFLFSEDVTISSRIWMLLSQMGCQNIYILTRDTDEEVLKHKFRPDSLAGPEL